MRNLLLSITTLAALGGVASADRIHSQPAREHGHGPVVRTTGFRAPVRAGRNEARRPIYASRPVIHERYLNYRVRPRVIVENYQPMDGYAWIAGAWSWDGYEWQWTAGHYEPLAY